MPGIAVVLLPLGSDLNCVFLDISLIFTILFSLFHAYQCAFCDGKGSGELRFFGDFQEKTSTRTQTGWCEARPVAPRPDRNCTIAGAMATVTAQNRFLNGLMAPGRACSLDKAPSATTLFTAFVFGCGVVRSKTGVIIIRGSQPINRLNLAQVALMSRIICPSADTRGEWEQHEGSDPKTPVSRHIRSQSAFILHHRNGVLRCFQWHNKLGFQPGTAASFHQSQRD
jgi:hypothetical protein